MLCLRFTFPAGRYHASAWGYQVNEAVIDWPPSPWRLLRAVIAGWHRLDDADSEAVARSLIGKLASCDPHYRLPRYGEGHTRHYMPNDSSTTMTFDAFLAFAPGSSLWVGFPGVELTQEESGVLDGCLAHLGYLGRSESWVEASQAPWEEAEGLAVEPGQTPTARQVLAAQSPQQYATWAKDARKSIKKALMKPPADLWSALQMGTAALQKARWSRPPGVRDVAYDLEGVRPERVRRQRAAPSRSDVRVVRYALVPRDNIRPRFRDGVRVAEAFHRAMASEADGLADAGLLIGKRDGKPLRDEGHAYITWSGLGSGRDLHRVTHIHMALPEYEARSGGKPAKHCFSAEQLRALRTVEEITVQGKSSEAWPRFRLVLEGEWSREDLAALPRRPGVLQAAKVWKSVTPVVLGRHPKMKKGVCVRDSPEEQVRDQLARLGLPPAEISPCEPERGDWVRFRRKRMGQGPGRSGVGAFGFQLVFQEPVVGPIAVGALAHFGLGRFEPDE